MTREEAKSKIEHFIHNDELMKIIDEIYDNFENRICINCKYCVYDEIECGYRCTNKHIRVSIFHNGSCSYFAPFKDFGCNRFERK